MPVQKEYWHSKSAQIAYLQNASLTPQMASFGRFIEDWDSVYMWFDLINCGSSACFSEHAQDDMGQGSAAIAQDWWYSQLSFCHTAAT